MSEFVTFLGRGDYKILQDDDGYLFSADSVLLANLSNIGAKDSVIDLGTGCGIIATLVAIKKNADRVVGVEIDEKTCDMARRSVKMNGLDDKINIICGDVRNIKSFVKSGEFDKAVCNPPYFNSNDGNENASVRAKARKQTDANLDDFVLAASYALKNGGDFFIVYPASDMANLFVSLKANGLEPKHAVLVYPKLSKGLDRVIVTAKKGGKNGLTTETLVVMDEDGKYTNGVKELYD